MALEKAQRPRKVWVQLDSVGAGFALPVRVADTLLNAFLPLSITPSCARLEPSSRPYAGGLFSGLGGLLLSLRSALHVGLFLALHLTPPVTVGEKLLTGWMELAPVAAWHSG